ncbi:MAG: MFS transporter [Chloroflexi bacterium B3_Chlor]|nr:MAG: MFS transporter [Chloroflexi bacterium B3_Chlor]
MIDEVIIRTTSDSIKDGTQFKAAPDGAGVDTGVFQTGRVVTITAAHLVHDTYTAFLAPLLPAFIAKLSLSKTEAGALTVFMQGPSVLQPYIGYLADRVSLRYLVILAPALTATMMSLLGIAPRYAVLAFLLTVVGLSSAAFHAVVPVIAGRLSGSSLGRGMGFWMVGGELGRTLGPIIIVTAVNFLTLEGTPWLMSGGLLASLLLYLLLKDVPRRPPEPSQGISFRQGLQGMRPLLVPLVGIITARVFMLAALTTYLPIFLTEEGASFWVAGVSLTVLEAAGVVGALTGGSLSDRMGRRLVLLVAMLATPLFMFIFLATSGWIRFPLLLLLGFTSLSVAPVIMALVQESFPENRALANGVYMALAFVIRSGAVIVLGAVGDLFGLRLAFTISAVIPLLGLPLLLMLPGRQPA